LQVEDATGQEAETMQAGTYGPVGVEEVAAWRFAHSAAGTGRRRAAL